jgi:hypothetical protein
MLKPLALPSHTTDAELATSLARLWPNREHESNAVASLCCRCGLHRWRQLNLEERAPDKKVHYCFWCSKVRIDGVAYEP